MLLGDASSIFVLAKTRELRVAPMIYFGEFQQTMVRTFAVL
jgi:hypothetical protein